MFYFTETPLLQRKVSQMQLLLSALYEEWPWKYHHILDSVLQGTRATHLSKQSSSSLRHRKPFKFIHVKYFKLQCMWCMSLLTSGIKPDVGNPMPVHHLVGLITVPWAESTNLAGAFPVGKKEVRGFCSDHLSPMVGDRRWKSTFVPWVPLCMNQRLWPQFSEAFGSLLDMYFSCRDDKKEKKYALGNGWLYLLYTIGPTAGFGWLCEKVEQGYTTLHLLA